MYADWIKSSTGLPCEGQQIEFLLDYRRVALEGSYTHDVFHSHWAQYTVDRVCSWRNLTEQCELASPAPNEATPVRSSATPRETSHFPLPAGGLAHAA